MTNKISVIFIFIIFTYGNSAFAEFYLPRVNMYLENPSYIDVENTTWVLYNEKGKLLGRATGDQSDLLQMAINYAVENGIPLTVTGRTYVTKPRPKLVSFLCTYKTINMPPITTGEIVFSNVVMLSRPKDGGPAIVFDSAEGLYFEQRGGQILYRGKSAAVLFSPKTSTSNADDAIQINTSKIKFSAITVQEQGPSGGVPVKFNIQKGSIWGNYFEFGETDGFNKGDYTISVSAPSINADDLHYKDTRFESNTIRASMLVRSNIAGIKLGNDIDDSSKIRHNIWIIGSIQPGNRNATGIISYGSYDYFNVGVIGSPNMQTGLHSGVFFGKKSKGNKINIGEVLTR